MATALDIITLALKASGAIGVGQTPLAENTNDALALLNMMLGQWQRKRWLVYHLVDVAKVATGAQSYTVGAGGDFNVARPDRIEAAFFRQIVASQPNAVDYPLKLLESREDYNEIRLKTLGSFPSYVWYDPAYPLGNLYVWPVPSSLYEIHISLKEQLGTFASLATAVNLPPEYQEALVWNLAARLRPLFQLPPEPSVTALARASLNTIRNANTQIPRLLMPADLVRPGIYNPYSDRNG